MDVVVPTECPVNVMVNKSSLSSTGVQLMWNAVSQSPDTVRGFFTGYRVRRRQHTHTHTPTLIDRVAGAIICLVASICLWALSCLNRLTFDLDFWHEGRH